MCPAALIMHFVMVGLQCCRVENAVTWFRICKISVLSEAGDIVPVRPVVQQLCSLYSFLDAQIAPTWADTY